MPRGSVSAWAGEVGCSLALVATGLGFAAAAWRMPLYEDGVPGPGLAPLMLGLALAALGLIIAAAAVMRRDAALIPVLDRDTLLAVLFLFAAVAAFEVAGFVPATFLFLLAGFVLIGRESWLPAATVAGAATLVTWALFVKALGVALPAGLLGLR